MLAKYSNVLYWSVLKVTISTEVVSQEVISLVGSDYF